jgi:hypothetical protein
MALRGTRYRLPRGDAAIGYALQHARRFLRPRLHAEHHLYRRRVAMGDGPVSRLRGTRHADRHANR